jgi:hypothetical protein
MGSDFDDAEDHVQDSSKYKVKCGFETIDHMLSGGWDISTLNVIWHKLMVNHYGCKTLQLGPQIWDTTFFI